MMSVCRSSNSPTTVLAIDLGGKGLSGHAELAAIQTTWRSALCVVQVEQPGRRPRRRGAACGPCSLYKQEEFLAHYHQRESAFSAIERKFGGVVRSYRLTAQVNECCARCSATT